MAVQDPSASIRVLQVDADRAFADSVAAAVERIDEQCTMLAVSTAEAALARLAETEVDCLVADYGLPDGTGIDLLKTVRQDHPELPFLLFTGTGSEAIASEAIRAGVTDYLRKDSESNQFERLASRIRTAVDRVRDEGRCIQWAQAMAIANEGVAIFDADGRYVDVNDAYATLHGAEPTAFIGEHWTSAVPDAEVQRFLSDVLPTLPESGGWTGESVGKRLDGGEFPTQLSLAPLDDGGSVCVIRDITDRLSREAKLRRNDATLDVLFGQSPDMISVHDGEGCLVDVNQRLCTELSYTEAELLGMPVWELDPNLSPEEAVTNWGQMAYGEIMKVETVYQRQDGSTFPVEVHLAKVQMSDADRFFVVSRNITARKEYEQQLQRQNERLAEFASIVSHDLRNPLNVAMGHVDLLRDECDSGHLDAIERSHTRMQDLIEELLQLARQGDLVSERESISLPEVVSSSWAAVHTAEASLQVRSDQVVWGDRSRLQQLFENLLRNAIEHGGDAVTITVGELVDGFYLEDDGPGIPADARNHVLEQGYSTTPAGTGLGLPIVTQIVTAHGWALDITESLDGGARFEITGVNAE